MSQQMSDSTTWDVPLDSEILVSSVSNNVDAQTVLIKSVHDLCTLICTKTWSAGTFSNRKRVAANFQSAQIMGLDIDGGISIAEVEAKLSGFKYIIAPTRSHLVPKNGTTCERFRVILFLSEPIIDATTYLQTWKLALQLIPQIDEACKDVSRQYFASTFIHSAVNGDLFPVQKFMPPTKSYTKPSVPSGTKFPVPAPVLQFMNGETSADWNPTLFKAAKLLQEAGYEMEDTIDLLNTMSNPQFTGYLDTADLKTIKSAYGTEGKYPPKINWPHTVQSKHGYDIVDPFNQNNFIYLLENILKLDVRYNELRHCMECNGRQWDDDDLSNFRMSCREFGLRPNVELLQDVIRAVAKKNSYHPFKEAVESIPWDGHDYITDLYNTITIDGPEEPIYKEYLRRWVVGMVTKVYNPGSQTNVLVFLGPQAAGKSLWIEKFSIVPNIFNESMIYTDSKDDKIKSASTVIWSISELDGVTRRQDASSIKGFLTNGIFDVRLPYDKYSKQMKSVCSFAASVNDPQFLVDVTGNRRFTVIPVTKLDKTHNVNMQQVLAQAFEAYKQGEKWYFERSEIEVINSLNEDYMPTTRMDNITLRLVPGDDMMSGDDILSLLGYRENRNIADYKSLGRALNLMKFKSKRITVHGRKVTVYGINKLETERNILKGAKLNENGN